MKRILLFLIMSALILFSSCAPRQNDPLAYQNGSLTAEVIFEKNGTKLGALIELGPMNEGARDAKITFTSPESVKGMTVERQNEHLIAKLDELCITPNEHALALADLFSLDGTITNTEVQNGLTLITLSGADTDYTLTLDAESRPKRISGHDFTLDIVWLEEQMWRTS